MSYSRLGDSTPPSPLFLFFVIFPFNPNPKRTSPNLASLSTLYVLVTQLAPRPHDLAELGRARTPFTLFLLHLYVLVTSPSRGLLTSPTSGDFFLFGFRLGHTSFERTFLVFTGVRMGARPLQEDTIKIFLFYKFPTEALACTRCPTPSRLPRTSQTPRSTPSSPSPSPSTSYRPPPRSADRSSSRPRRAPRARSSRVRSGPCRRRP